MLEKIFLLHAPLPMEFRGYSIPAGFVGRSLKDIISNEHDIRVFMYETLGISFPLSDNLFGYPLPESLSFADANDFLNNHDILFDFLDFLRGVEHALPV